VDRIEAYSAFVAVADARSFVGAARALGQSPVKVTRLVAALENHLGVPLFNRSTRSVTITSEGAALLDRARALLANLREAEQLVMGSTSEPQGEIHITAPVMFGRLHVLPVVADLLSRHDGISVRMMLVDRNIRIVEEGIDVAVRIGHLADSSLMMARLGSVGQTLVASPDYLARRGTPRVLADLARHDCIGGSGIRHDNVWRFGRNSKDRFELAPRLSLNDVASAIAAAEEGAGIANVLSYQVQKQVQSGQLVSLLQDMMPGPLPVQLLFARSRSANLAVRAFIAAMRERAARENWGDLQDQ